MKQLIPIFSLAILMVACNSNPNANTTAASATPQVQQAPAYNVDTVGLAQFQQWKVTHELAADNEYQTAIVHNKVAAPVKRITRTYAAPLPQAQASSTASTNSGTVSSNTDGGAMSSESSNTAKAPVKKGISKTVKGTAIGAGVGAAAGAVINKKNRVLGGVIGGVIGGAVGYGIGHHMDKQDAAPLFTSN
jgi:YMGG-like Gly-zipper